MATVFMKCRSLPMHEFFLSTVNWCQCNRREDTDEYNERLSVYTNVNITENIDSPLFPQAPVTQNKLNFVGEMYQSIFWLDGSTEPEQI